MTPLEINKKIAEVKGWKPGDKCNGYGGELPNSSDGWFCDECGYIGQWGEDGPHEKQITNVEGGGDMINDKMDEYLKHLNNLASHTQNYFYLKVIIEKEKLELKLQEAKKVIEFYATPEVYFCEGVFEDTNSWRENKSKSPYVESIIDGDEGERARNWLEKWGDK